jgi:type IV pilus biogenesis/stability protein PilW
MDPIAELYQLAAQYYQSGHFSEAAALYRKVLQSAGHYPDELLVGTYINLGNVLKDQGDISGAIVCFREALRTDPRHAHAHINLGNALLSRGQLDVGIGCFRQALQLDPGNARAHYNLGVALMRQGETAQASECFNDALRFEPRHADAHNNLGVILREQGRRDEAAWNFQQALNINPNHAQVYNNLGLLLQDQEQYVRALACFQQSLRIQPHQADAYYNLGLLHKEQGQFDQAAAYFEQAIAIDPGHKQALWNRCQMRLLQGDYARGLPDFELRWAQPGMVRRPFPQPRWDGSPLHGKTILVYAEHGLGDTIHFLRYLPFVKRCGGTLVFECQPVLYRLLQGVQGVDQLIAAGKPLPRFEVHASLMSLPGFFVTPETVIPANIPYLVADPKFVTNWGQEIEFAAPRKPAEADDKPNLHVGIVWQGKPTHPHDRERSVPLKCFETLARAACVRLISLQIGPGLEQLKEARFPVVDLGSRFDPQSMADVAAVLVNLDLLVSVDSAIAHVAGALGVKVWMALPLVPDWRWLLERADSPWYPTMRLFRQRQKHDWDDVFERIGAALSEFSPGSQNQVYSSPKH